jgi:hypothetical protein
LTNDQFFTRADWRPGKKRKRQLRTKPWGGRKSAPPAFLEAAKRTAIKPGFVNRRICHAIKRDGAPCGNLALSGLAVCGPHGGFSIWARQGKLKRSGKSAAIRAQRAAAIEGRSEGAPAALMHLRVYQEANERMRMRLIQAFQSVTWGKLLKEIRDSKVCV